MTNHQPIDARPSAWVGAMDRITAAQKLKMDPNHKNRVADPLPELYWATLAESAVLADLAKAPDPVGFIAGAHLTDRHARIAEHRAMFDKLVDVVQKRREPDCPPEPENSEQFASPPFTAGHRVRITQKASIFVGREGTVVEVHKSPNGGAPALVVEFDPDSLDPEPHRRLDVSARDVELIEPGAGHRIDKGDRVRVTMSRRCMDGKYAGRTGTVRDIGVTDWGGWIEVELDHMEGLRYASRTVITVRTDMLEKVAV